MVVVVVVAIVVAFVVVFVVVFLSFLSKLFKVSFSLVLGATMIIESLHSLQSVEAHEASITYTLVVFFHVNAKIRSRKHFAANTAGNAPNDRRRFPRGAERDDGVPAISSDGASVFRNGDILGL